MQRCMEWDDIRVFLEVARHGSFTAAAQSMGIKQSTVSRRIAQFEELLGTQLFDRKRAELSPIGERLRARAEAVEASVIAFQDELEGFETVPQGKVRLALTESMAIHIVLPTVMPELKKRFPLVQLELLTGYDLARLTQRDAEMALRFVRPQSGDLVGRRIAQIPTCILAHRKFAGLPLEQVDWILAEFDRFEASEKVWFEKHIAREPALRTSSYMTQIEAMRSGVGAALLPRSLLRVDPNIVELDWGLPPGPSLDLWLIAPQALRNVPRIACVWDLIEELVPPLVQ